MMINHGSFDIDMIGVRRSTGKIEIAKNGEPTFSFEMGGDADPLYRCRLIRKILICLGPYGFVEFKKLQVQDEQRASSAQAE